MSTARGPTCQGILGLVLYRTLHTYITSDLRDIVLTRSDSLCNGHVLIQTSNNNPKILIFNPSNLRDVNACNTVYYVSK